MYPALLLGPASQSINVASLRKLLGEPSALGGSILCGFCCNVGSGVALPKMVQPVSQKTLQKSPKLWLTQESPNLKPSSYGEGSGEGYGLAATAAARLPGFVEGGDLGDAATGCRKAGEVAASAEMGVAALLRLSATAATSQLPPTASQKASVTLTAHLRDTDGEVAPLAVLTSQRRVRKPRLRLGAWRLVWGGGGAVVAL